MIRQRGARGEAKGPVVRAGANVVTRLAVVVWLCSCNPLGGADEFVNPRLSGDTYRRFAVIASDDKQNTLRNALEVVTDLESAGLSASQPGGLWESEAAVMDGLCPEDAEDAEDAEYGEFDGVLFVRYDRMTLRDCETHAVAYDIQGGLTGVRSMTERLLKYLRIGPVS